jgi:hypothetical protein
MPTMREAIREKTRLSRMRQGQEVPEYVDIPSMEGVRVALVPLTEAELSRGLAYAASDEEVPESFSGAQYRSRRAIQSDVWHASREPGEPEKRVFESIEEMIEELTPADIDYLSMHLATLMNFASPLMDGLTDDDLDFLGRAWQAIRLNELTGRQWAAAKLCLSVLLPELLQARLSGRTSTDGSTTSTLSDEFTSDVSPS